MRKSTKMIFLILLGLLLAACGVQNTGVSQATVIPAETKTPTITRIPTRTLSPSATINSESATLFAMKTQSSLYWNATLPARGVICDEGFQVDRYQGFIGLTTDDWWVYTCVSEDRDYSKNYTRILRANGAVNWSISHDGFSWANGNSVYLVANRWTSDGLYVYLEPKIIIPGAFTSWDPWSYFKDSTLLLGLDLETGKVDFVLPYFSAGYAFAISPDNRYLAYSQNNPGNEVRIREIDTGKEEFLELNESYTISGFFSWVPDSTKVVFASGLDERAGVSLFSLEINNMQYQTLLSQDTRLLVPFFDIDSGGYWLDESILYLTSLDMENWDIWSINIDTGQVFEPNATPTPTTSP